MNAGIAFKWKKMTQNNLVIVCLLMFFFSDFPKIIPRGVARFFHFRVEINAPNLILYLLYYFINNQVDEKKPTINSAQLHISVTVDE